ncbi:hypothetical protein GCM10011504_09990 [Siccirubricoccus deserti]|nr:hypothetical protein GCM10011504_09990 [Siccirubricoccus deserti]
MRTIVFGAAIGPLTGRLNPIRIATVSIPGRLPAGCLSRMLQATGAAPVAVPANSVRITAIMAASQERE